MRLSLILSIFVVAVIVAKASAESQYESSTDFAKYAMKLRKNALAETRTQSDHVTDEDRVHR